MEVVIGREEEIKTLEEALRSGIAEPITVYGGRRIGKTWKVNNYYGRMIRFELTGIHDAV